MFGEIGFFQGCAMWLWVWVGTFETTAKYIKEGKRLSRGDLRRIARFPNIIDEIVGSEEYPLNIDPKDREYAKKIFAKYGTRIEFKDESAA